MNILNAAFFFGIYVAIYANYHVMCSSNHPKFSVRIVGIFVTDSELPYTLELAAPAVEIAVEKARRLYPSIEWTQPAFRNGSSRCTANFAGVFAAEEFYLRRVTTFIGPACGQALGPVARMAAHWNIPVFTSGGLQSEFSQKSTFRTLTRLSLNLDKMGVFLLKLLRYFDWKHVTVIVHEASEILSLIYRALTGALGLSEEITYEVVEMRRSLSKVNISRILVEASKEARSK